MDAVCFQFKVSVQNYCMAFVQLSQNLQMEVLLRRKNTNGTGIINPEPNRSVLEILVLTRMVSLCHLSCNSLSRRRMFFGTFFSSNCVFFTFCLFSAEKFHDESLPCWGGNSIVHYHGTALLYPLA